MRIYTCVALNNNDVVAFADGDRLERVLNQGRELKSCISLRLECFLEGYVTLSICRYEVILSIRYLICISAPLAPKRTDSCIASINTNLEDLQGWQLVGDRVYHCIP